MAGTRSPNFPFVPLEMALQRAHTVSDKEGRSEVAVETIVGHWGYAAKSSGGRQTVAALRHFGLLEGRGGRVRLTDLARSILFSEEGTEQWIRLVQEAALKPTIHEEIWAKYGGETVSDQNLRYYLVVDRGFAESGAADFIRELRATFAFARMGDYQADNLSSDSIDKPEDEGEMSTLTLDKLHEDKPPSGSRRVVQLPYSATDWAVLQAPFPVTGDEWDQMIAVLQAMKPGLVKRDVHSHDTGSATESATVTRGDPEPPL
jgi:hypothetical protein